MFRNIVQIVMVTLTALLINSMNVFSQRFESDSIFTWKLIETNNISSQSTLQFIPRQDIVPISWDFGDSNSSNEATPIHTYSYTSWDDSIAVTLSYSLNGETLTHSREIPLSPAFFFVRPDINLGRLVTYKRVFLNGYIIPNNPDSLGNLRFSWFIDGSPLSGNTFDNNLLGQWPNIYYSFSTAGIHSVKLEVSNTNSGETAEFTHTLNIQPDLTSGRVKLENIPNVFTPNGDGLNDFFEVSTSGTAWFDIRIFTRSGALINKTESSIILWDGKNNQGNDMPEGIYYYVIEDYTNQYEPASGFVYLFKGKK